MLMVGMGKKVDAIRHYRERFGVSLAEAQAQINRLETGEGIDLPEPVQTPSRPEAAPEYRNPEIRIPPNPSRRRPMLVPLFIALLGVCAAGAAVFFGLSGANLLGQLGFSKTPGAVLSIPTVKVDGSLFSRAPTVLDPAAIVPVSDQPADVVLQARRFETDPYTTTLVRYSGATGKILWETAPFSGKDVYLDQVITGPEQAYVVIEDQIFAFGLEDGKPAWNAKLTDKLGYCGANRSCAVIQEGVLLVLSTDDTLQALDTTSGSLLWQRRVYYPSQGIHYAGKQVVVLDQDSKSNKTAVVFLNLTGGQEEMRIAPTNLYGSPDLLISGDHVYLITNQAIENWDISASAPALSAEFKGDFFFRDNQPVIGADVLFAAGDHAVTAINLVDGAAKDLVNDADYDLQPLTLSGSQLLVLAKRTRGTAKYELWNVDARTGEKAVIDNFGESQMITDTFPSSESQDKYVWTWKLNGSSLAVIKFKASPNQAVIDNYDINTGKKLKSATAAFDKIKDDSYSIRSMIGWQGHTLWVMLDTQVYAIDCQAGKIVSAFP